MADQWGGRAEGNDGVGDGDGNDDVDGEYDDEESHHDEEEDGSADRESTMLTAMTVTEDLRHVV